MAGNQIIDRRVVAIPGPTGSVTPEAVAARNAAKEYRDQAEAFSATTQTLQDAAVSGLLATGPSTAPLLQSLILQRAAVAVPRGNRIVLMGDSITAMNGGLSTATPTQPLSGYSSKGMWRWAAIMLNQDVEIIGNSGIGGQETAAIRARFQTDVLDLAPDMVSVLAGTNDDGPEDATWENLRWMYDTALAANIFVVAFTIPPQTNGELAAYRQGVNAQIRSYVRTHAGIMLVDLAAVWQDPNAGGFVARTGYLSDGTHPSALGAQVAGWEIARVVRQVVSPLLAELPSAQPPDNMLSNGRFSGTGTSLPSGWEMGGGGQVTYGPGPRGIGQRLVVSVPAGGYAALTANVTVGELLHVGDEYDFTITMEPLDLERSSTSAQRLNVYTQEYDGTAFTRSGDAVYIDGSADYGSARFPAAAGVFRTQRAKLRSGKTLMQVVVGMNGGGTYMLSNATARNLTLLENAGA